MSQVNTEFEGDPEYEQFEEYVDQRGCATARAMDRAFKRRAEEPNVDCEVLVLITLLRRTKMKHNVTST